MSRPVDTADKTRETAQNPSERVVFIVGIVAAAVVGLVIAFVHPG